MSGAILLMPNVGPARPGLFAPKGEKALYKRVLTGDANLIASTGDEFPEYALPAWSLGGILLVEIAPQRSRQLLTQSLDLGDPSQHQFTISYLSSIKVSITVDVVGVDMPLGLDAVALTLVGILQEEGELQAAVDVLSAIASATRHSSVVRLAMADVLAEGGAVDDVISLTDGAYKPSDDLTALFCLYRARALRLKGLKDAAHAVLKEVLASKDLYGTVVHHALMERSRTYADQGKRDLALKDIERIYADDSTYPGLLEAREEMLAGQSPS